MFAFTLNRLALSADGIAFRAVRDADGDFADWERLGYVEDAGAWSAVGWGAERDDLETLAGLWREGRRRDVRISLRCKGAMIHAAMARRLQRSPLADMPYLRWSKRPRRKGVPEMRATQLYCPQCGNDTDALPEGVCPECLQANQTALDLHLTEYDRWDRMTDKQREDAIRWAARNPSY